jgi:beta-mannosidase
MKISSCENAIRPRFFQFWSGVLFLILILGTGVLSAQKVYPGKLADLNGEWDLYFGEQDENAPNSPDEIVKTRFKKIKATVPGNVEIDLMKAGLLPDISIGTNVFKLREYETYQWWYARKFVAGTMEGAKRVNLVFEGLDCIADIWVNGKNAGHTENMFIEHRLDVTNLVRTGENSIYVRIMSPVLEARKHEITMLSRAQGGSRWESLFIRKAPHMYGWDIMPRIVSAGIWRDVYLEQIPGTGFRSVYWATQSVDLERKTAVLLARWDLASDLPVLDGLKMRVKLSGPSGATMAKEVPVVSHHGGIQLTPKDVDLWWPRGFGGQPLYLAELSLLDAGGKVICQSQDRLGIRTIRLNRTDVSTSDHPGRFQFEVNGIPVFVKGTNWVPLDGLHSRDKQHLSRMFEMLIDLNCNMVRCWGGNVYEDSEFYDLCDKYGIMVWQDFSLACARYPQDSAFLEKMRKEATAVVKKFRNHASLAVWAGNNENDEEYTINADPGMPPMDPNEEKISRQILKDMVRDNDPFRDYLPSSPYYSPEVMKAGFGRNLMPEVHMWGPRGYYKAPFYTSTNANFVSEIGYHGCPSVASIKQMMEPGSVVPDFKNRRWNDQWLAKATMPLPKEFTDSQLTRNDLMVNQVEALFGTCPESFDEFVFASQATQGEAKKFFIDFWRSNKPNKMGILWWNLKDGWPILSDAVVDFYYRKKIAYDYIKRAQNDIQAIISEPADRRHDVVMVNDTGNQVSGNVVIRSTETGAEILNTAYICPSNSRAVAAGVTASDKQDFWVVEWNVAGGEKFRSHYLCGKPPFKLSQYKKWFDKAGYRYDAGN